MKYSQALITTASASTLGESKDVGLADTEGRLYYAILCNELDHMQILVSMLGLDPIPGTYWGKTVYLTGYL